MSDAPELAGYEHVYSGKVRDLYAPLDADGRPGTTSCSSWPPTGSRRSTTCSTPRSPTRARSSTQLSLWWFDQLEALVPNHVVSLDVPAEVAGRAVLVRRLEMVPVECIARAYLTGGGLEEYARLGSVSGVTLPRGWSTATGCPSRSSPRRPRRRWASTTCR